MKVDVSSFDLDSGKYYFGGLCKRKHEADKYRRSLRRASNRTCVICDRIRIFDRRIDEQTSDEKLDELEKQKMKRQAYYEKHRDRLKEQSLRYYYERYKHRREGLRQQEK